MKKSSSIKNKVILISVITVSILFIVLILAVSTIVRKSLEDLESKMAEINIRRAVQAYNFVLENYEKKITDWAEWDDTYKFIEDLNDDFIESNLGEETLSNLRVDQMVFFDTRGDLKYATSSSKFNNLPLSESKIFSQLVTEKLNGNKLDSGLVYTNRGTVIYSAHEILKSDGGGEPKGYLFFGRYVDSWLADDISSILQIKTTIKSEYGEISELTDVDNSGVYFRNIIDADEIRSTFAIPIDRNNGIIFSFSTGLDLLNVVSKNAKYLLLFILTLSFSAVCINYIVIKRFVLDEVELLRSDVAKSTDNLDTANISETSKSFEIFELRSDINTLINTVNTSRKDLLSKIEELNRLNRLMVGREAKMKELKEVIEELKKRIV